MSDPCPDDSSTYSLSTPGSSDLIRYSLTGQKDRPYPETPGRILSYPRFYHTHTSALIWSNIGLRGSLYPSRSSSDLSFFSFREVGHVGLVLSPSAYKCHRLSGSGLPSLSGLQADAPLLPCLLITCHGGEGFLLPPDLVGPCTP